MLGERLPVLVLALAVSTFGSVGNLYWRSMDTLPYKTALERSTVVKVVSIFVDDKGVLRRGFGSGVRIRHNAILTCSHVVKGDIAEVIYLDGSHETGRVVVRHARSDLAVIEVKQPTGRIAKLGKEVVVGEPVVAIGHPFGLPWNTTLGIVSLVNEMGVISDAVINGGNSGGALFNQNMELVGIAQAILGPLDIKAFHGHSLFVPPFKIKAILRHYDRITREAANGPKAK